MTRRTVRRMPRKLSDVRGIAAIIVLLVIAVLIMSVIVLIPIITDGGEKANRAQDDRQEETAINSAKARVTAYESGFKAVYDAENKRFVEDLSIEALKEIKPYGQSKEHLNMVLYVVASDQGNVTLDWFDPKKKSDRKELLSGS